MVKVTRTDSTFNRSLRISSNAISAFSPTMMRPLSWRAVNNNPSAVIAAISATPAAITFWRLTMQVT
jgi:hypothetical protein